MINIIVSMSKNGVIGVDGELPWYLSNDLKRFKKVTMGSTVIMGRKTHESLKKKLFYRKSEVLPGRQNIVLTRQKDYKTKGCEIAHSLEEAYKLAQNEQIFIIGGESLYNDTIDVAEMLYITQVDVKLSGDGGGARFLKFDKSDWKLVFSEKHSSDEKHDYNYEFQVYRRVIK